MGTPFDARTHWWSAGPPDPLVRGYRISQAVYVATQLGIPDLFADGPREIDELAHT